MKAFSLIDGRVVALAAGALVLSAGTGLAFAGWMNNAPAIFMALAEQGLAWCF